jgi:hypothetical protein
MILESVVIIYPAALTGSSFNGDRVFSVGCEFNKCYLDDI